MLHNRVVNQDQINNKVETVINHTMLLLCNIQIYNELKFVLESIKLIMIRF